MLNIVIRCGNFVEWFLIPETYNTVVFDALRNLPLTDPVDHIALWQKWIIDIGGKYSGPRTLNEFHGLDGRHINIKVDNNRLYIFNDPVEKTLFYVNGQWCEVLNFDNEKLPWLDWLMNEPGVAITKRYDNFQRATGAYPIRDHILEEEWNVTRYVYQETTPAGFIRSDKVLE